MSTPMRGTRCSTPRRAHKNSREGGNAAGNRSTRNADIVLVKNSSGSDVARFGVLGISGVIFTPTDSLATFQDQVAVTGVTPTTASHVGKFVVLLDPIANGKVGRGWIAGVCQVQVDVTDTAHKFCDVRNSDRAKLVSSASGSARIIYSESGTGTKWCVVRIGDGESATASTIRMGQFTGAWSNQPPDNIKTVQLYKKHPTSGSPNAFVPDDGNIVVAINLFSYIPTPRGGPSSLWAALCLSLVVNTPTTCRAFIMSMASRCKTLRLQTRFGYLLPRSANKCHHSCLGVPMTAAARR